MSLYAKNKKLKSTPLPYCKMENIIAARRDEVFASYEAAKKTNNRLFLEKDYRATEEYIYPNQKVDANRILSAFYTDHRRVVCVQKKTKVGADGLMIELAKLMATHPDDTFVVNTESIRILTGMSNTGWERDMIEKSPSFLKDKIIHHGRLSKANLQHIRDSLIIIDEIDTGNKEFQVLHKVLRDADLLDVTQLVERNIRFVLISATMMKERYDLYQWDDLHEAFQMTIPPEYVGHDYFLTKGIIKEFYSLNKKEAIQRWIREDILDYYRVPCMCPSCNPTQNPGKQDFRVHIVRGNQKTAPLLQAECERTGILFKNHSSTDRLSAEQIHDIFIKPLTQHIVLCVKGFFRRANLIPNEWKKRIGATLELYTKIVDNNVQIQGLVGRMTGYWRSIMENGHKTGPYRTSIKAMKEYEASYHDPFGANSYQSAGFKKKDGKVTAGSTMLSPHNIKNLVPCDPPQVEVISVYDITEPYEDREELYNFMKARIRNGTITSYRNADSNIQYRGVTTPLYHYENEEQFKKLDIFAGINKEAKEGSIVCRIMPVMYGTLHWVAIYLKSSL